MVAEVGRQSADFRRHYFPCGRQWPTEQNRRLRRFQPRATQGRIFWLLCLTRQIVHSFGLGQIDVAPVAVGSRPPPWGLGKRDDGYPGLAIAQPGLL
jgi:hypothetical protein